MKNITIFNMHCGVHYYHAKIEIKIQLLYGEKLYYGRNELNDII